MCPDAERARELRPGCCLGPSKHLDLHFASIPETLLLIKIFGFILFLISKQLQVLFVFQMGCFQKKNPCVSNNYYLKYEEKNENRFFPVL